MGIINARDGMVLVIYNEKLTPYQAGVLAEELYVAALKAADQALDGHRTNPANS